LGNACYNLEQNLVFSSALHKNMKIKIKRTTILLVLLFCYETWTLTLSMEKRLRFFENRMLRKMFGAERDEVNRETKRLYLYNEENYDLYSSPNVIWVTKPRRMRRAGYIADMGDRRGANGFWWKNLGDKDHLEALRLYGWITLKWIFRLMQIIHMTLGQQSGKN